jgi:hypothetical protein
LVPESGWPLLRCFQGQTYTYCRFIPENEWINELEWRTATALPKRSRWAHSIGYCMVRIMISNNFLVTSDSWILRSICRSKWVLPVTWSSMSWTWTTSDKIATTLFVSVATTTV